MRNSHRAPVLFDLDGTLVASGDLIIECFQLTLDRLGLPQRSEDALRIVIGPPLGDSFRDLVGLPEDEVPRAIEIYRGFYTPRFLEPPLYPGVASLMADLAAAGIPLATATTKLERYAVAQMEHWELDRYFTVIAGATSDATSSKAAVVASALSRLRAAGVEVGEVGVGGVGVGCAGAGFGGAGGSLAGSGAVLVGDRSFDVEGAAANGIRVVGAGWGYGTAAEFESDAVIAVAADVEELRGMLLG